MNRRITDLSAPYQNINNTSKISGMSRDYVRKGCKAGKIPHVMSGGVYMIHVPKFLEMLDAAAAESIH